MNFRLSLVVSLLAGLFLESVYSATCGSFKTSTLCATQAKCVWQGGVCQCKDQLADFVFLIDSSGSIGSTRFTTQKTFVKQIIDQVLPANSGIGIIRFASSVTTIQELNPPKTFAQSKTAIDLMGYTGGSTFMGDAVQAGLVMLGSSTKQNKRIFLITDGEPNGGTIANPCDLKTTIANTQGLSVIILGIGGGFSRAAVECLVQKEKNPSDWIIEISAYDPALFNSVLPKLDTAFCPQSFDLKITEVRPVLGPAATDGTYWFEAINAGVGDIPLQYVSMTGLFQGQLVPTGDTTVLPAGGVLVVYDGTVTAANIPTCQACACTPKTNGGKWCTTLSNPTRQVKYISCGTPTDSCILSAVVGARVTNSWTVTLSDITVPASPLPVDSVSYDPTANWPSIPNGFTFELRDWSLANNIGVNWQQSCDTFGTPGDYPNTNCTVCTDVRCRSFGDSSAACDPGTGVCNCVGAYYYPQDNICITLQPPAQCTATLVKLNNGIYVMEFQWSTVSTPPDARYNGRYKGTTSPQKYESVTNFKQVSDFDTNLNFQTTTTYGNVTTLYYGKDSIGVPKVYESQYTACTLQTSPPTPSPTQPPTTLQTFFGGGICPQDRCDCYQRANTCSGPAIAVTLPVGPGNFLVVRRLPLDYAENVTVYWELDGVSVSNTGGSTVRRLMDRFIGRGLLQTTNTSNTTQSPFTCNATDSICPKAGMVVVRPGDASAAIRLDVRNAKKLTHGIRITACDSFSQQCYPVYPYNMTININPNSGNGVSVTTNQTPQWLWWVLALLAIFLLLLALLVYKYWWQNRATNKELDTTKKDLDNAIAENELGFGADLAAGDVEINPLGTGIPGSGHAPTDFMGSEMANRKQMASGRADVPIQQFNYRQEMGQQQAIERA